jgi:hypothetical protein
MWLRRCFCPSKPAGVTKEEGERRRPQLEERREMRRQRKRKKKRSTVQLP